MKYGKDDKMMVGVGGCKRKRICTPKKQNAKNKEIEMKEQ